ncbi:Oidioi.mRNA.OKI2018_I69.PAR.g10852.t1.cds [Oikopleura dioica]|uniref:Oidioi.mRNA.OKI2018_I69.PAR.g10852.t1.cds n=1 Tax=Oikopleura dioica TaxID=34765 RepID=A0ABN7RX65_OIKDI|nr:Oidioi.mRNA.OKI2018_I69.PAR.g10852.t1.cds [Oikopleura dioica]
MGNSPPQRHGPQPHGHQEIHNPETYVMIANLKNKVENLEMRNKGLKRIYNKSKRTVATLTQEIELLKMQIDQNRRPEIHQTTREFIAENDAYEQEERQLEAEFQATIRATQANAGAIIQARINLDKFENCVICTRQYDNQGHHRVVLRPCGHIVGERCFLNWGGDKCPYQCEFVGGHQRIYVGV